ncbi:uncharacterized protein JCM6883_006541 [Sporobolomyces salmoneus]|uniref:uncharacterized protein n=1 Tax=Sporobolomyces salmoneus TaxID=183962 RepID=UPI00316F94D5
MSGYDPPYPVYTDPNFPAPSYDQHQQPSSNSYDPYGGQNAVVDHQGLQPGTADYSNPLQYQQHSTHDPFNPPPTVPHSTSSPYGDSQWAQPVPQPANQGDLGDYHHPLGPPHSHSFDSSNTHNPQDPFASQAHLGGASNAGHQDPTDDEPDSAPLLHQHNRWSTNQPGGTSGPFPGQADPSIGLPGGFDPTLLGGGQPGGGGGYSDDIPIAVQYGSIPQRQPRRYKTVKRVQLYNGNLVLDCQVPPKLLERVPRKDDREFTHMRYTAVTCDPDEFLNERYSLRQILYETPRRTELFIVLTMYNEDEVLFCRTMHGVMKNIQHLCERNRSKTWGADGWKKVVVCIVSDGRAKINSRTLSVLAAMGVYQDGVAKNVVAGKPVTGHLYEYTTQVSIDPDLKMKSAERGIVPVQICFLLKEKK